MKGVIFRTFCFQIKMIKAVKYCLCTFFGKKKTKKRTKSLHIHLNFFLCFHFTYSLLNPTVACYSNKIYYFYLGNNGGKRLFLEDTFMEWRKGSKLSLDTVIMRYMPVN